MSPSPPAWVPDVVPARCVALATGGAISSRASAARAGLAAPATGGAAGVLPAGCGTGARTWRQSEICRRTIAEASAEASASVSSAVGYVNDLLYSKELQYLDEIGRPLHMALRCT
ncbi:hypothetical protein, partial [Pseudoxanthomonas sp. X-1]|uniref:hypothetical protein n=1 Tax=Pseudoxanthomonas sp. X-1 TaxID=2571115 RepID=UPI00197EB3A0